MIKMINRKTEILSIQLIVSVCFLTFSFSLCQATVTLTVGSGSGTPGSKENLVISMDNSNDRVRGLQMDICDEDDYLTCMEYETTGRTSRFSCLISEVDGCCRVILFSFSNNLIDEGTGPIFIIKYGVSWDAPPGECINLNLEKVKVLDKNNQYLDVASVSGKFCFLPLPVDLILTPDSSKILKGGTLGFQATVANNTDEVQIVYFATEVTLPNGSSYPPSGHLLGPYKVTLDPYKSKSGYLTQYIPTTAPLGIYTYHGYIGKPGVGIIDKDSFDFEVILTSTEATGSEEWQTVVDEEFFE